ncbi:MAG: 4-(cytidine 5'-diphospho)-2-C-methyl-D-erythritol kinase [Bacteroides sp.]|nr:4-(cytidine 5'-diphospho)-2-C-methyl-D-erythritol kinase [Ruminococcus flavefaciens]MCM1554914.1 4-(cytidine 5'-diphospho)-2-C-methyl-D-erythritol kinase [Bacteroides sp.]
MLFFPPAKINIGLRILRKRADAYHDLELSFFAVPELCDVLEITPAAENVFLCEGLPVAGNPDDNLVLKARNLIDRRLSSKLPPCRIHLLKKIPMGSGLGGGSSDATYTLIGLNKEFKLGFSQAELSEMAGTLGADCAFFTQRQACIGYGKGDELHPLQTGHNRRYTLVIVVPDFGISTAQAYKGSQPQEHRPPLAGLLSADISTWRATVENDFEKTLRPLYPQIDSIKEQLYRKGALYASLSGSGSAVFGIFDLQRHSLVFEFPDSYFIHQSDIPIL